MAAKKKTQKSARKRAGKRPRAGLAKKRHFDARPDTMDFRDRMFIPTLIEVPPSRPLEIYRKLNSPILDQGTEGACTGFGLAAMANYLLRARAGKSDKTPVSPRMLYEMAKRYDEWTGEDYEGSSARGAMKGWYKHGVCSETVWKYAADGHLTPERATDAAERPLGAYFRVNHKDLVAMHAAMAEVGVLYATATVHEGWDNVGADGIIHAEEGYVGGHAFLLVGYDTDGFWLQNSWGAGWGKDGFGHLSYSDWLEHGMDVWVGRLGAPVRVDVQAFAKGGQSGVASATISFLDIRPHVVAIGNEGKLRPTGPMATTEEILDDIFTEQFPRITRGWRKKRVLLYAHGGLVSESNALLRVENYLAAMLDAQVYPIAFIWKTDFWTTVTNLLQDALRRRRAEGFLDQAKDFMLDRVDDALEPIARHLGGKAVWSEMKENAILATRSANGGARLVAQHLSRLVDTDSAIELHVAGHSAGSIFCAPLVQLIANDGPAEAGPLRGEAGLGIAIASCTLWAPACTIDLFKGTYLPAIESRQIKDFGLFNLTDDAEQDDNCARIYNKSLLYLVANAFEERPHIPIFQQGEPILGMDRFVTHDKVLTDLFGRRYAEYVRAPNQNVEGARDASRARHHGDFDDDAATVKATLARILGLKNVRAVLSFPSSPSSARDRRHEIRMVQQQT